MNGFLVLLVTDLALVLFIVAGFVAYRRHPGVFATTTACLLVAALAVNGVPVGDLVWTDAWPQPWTVLRDHADLVVACCWLVYGLVFCGVALRDRATEREKTRH